MLQSDNQRNLHLTQVPYNSDFQQNCNLEIGGNIKSQRGYILSWEGEFKLLQPSFQTIILGHNAPF